MKTIGLTMNCNVVIDKLAQVTHSEPVRFITVLSHGQYYIHFNEAIDAQAFKDRCFSVNGIKATIIREHIISE